ncbi:MAG: DNA recombination protein RmuC, partial [Paracoccaceae bacterium]|nr:DNA recombination protein RmuC [Paracoccaceae bacterium]
MITFNGQTYALNDPLVAAALAGAGLLLLLFILIIVTMRAAGRSAKMTEPMLFQMQNLGSRVQSLSDGQNQLAGGLHHVSEAQATAQAKMLQLMEQRLADVTRNMTETLQGTSTRTARSLGDLQQRLETIDKAQTNIEKLSGDVLSLQDILSNKQTRGAFGEIQLN